MKRRGQITIFIILAIIILAAVSAFFLAKSENHSKEYFIQNNKEPSLNDIQSFSLDCLKETTQNALTTIGIQGGLYQRPVKAYDLEWTFIPYYYDRGEILMPSKEKIQEEFSKAIDANITTCLDTIQFKSFQLHYENPKSKTEIKKEEITITTDLTIQITKDKKTTKLELNVHPLTIKSLLGEMIAIGEYITDSHKEDPDFICINCVAELSKEKGLFVDFIGLEDDTTLIMMIENKTQSEPFIFQFVNKYTINQTVQ